MKLFAIMVETSLQKQLKELCDSKGRETNPDQSAVVLNNLGLLYRCKSPDKISLIQSAALLNAAIVRKPANEKFQTDLNDLCKYVLEFANAIDKDADLLQISNSAATQIEDMRNMAKQRLRAIKKIPKSNDQTITLASQNAYVLNIASLQSQIAMDYKCIMANISRKCIQTLGKPPCKYALVGMGSLAREEITPYSDFEHIIVLQNLANKSEAEIEKYKDYFRWFSVLFHIIVINLKESIIPSVCIPCLNDGYSNSKDDWFFDKITPRGISFDGMMPHACKFPLGRTLHTELKPWTTELIKPVDKMVKYLDVDVDLKNGYKLGDILTRTCFVEGDERIYHLFSDQVSSILKQNPVAQQTNFVKQLKEDLDNLDIAENLSSFTAVNDINIKRVIYRSITLFVSALGRLQQINKNSAFNIIQECFTRNIFSDYTSTKLKNAVAVACHVRLFHYMNKKRQQDYIHGENDFWGRAKLQEMTKVVSINNLIDALTTASTIQLFLRNNIDISEIDEFLQYSNIEKQIPVLNMLGLFNDTIRIGLSCLKNEKLTSNRTLHLLNKQNNIGIAFIRTGNFSNYLEICQNYQPLIDHSQDPSLTASCRQAKVCQITCFLCLKNYSKALKESDSVLKAKLEINEMIGVLFVNALSKYHLSQFVPALSSFRELCKLSKSLKSTNKHLLQMHVFPFTSSALIKIGRKEQGLQLAIEGLNCAEMIGANSWFYENFAKIIREIRPTSNETQTTTFRPCQCSTVLHQLSKVH